MRLYIIMLVMFVGLVLAAEANDRYVITEPKNVIHNYAFSYPSWAELDPQSKAALREVNAHQYDGRHFFNESDTPYSVVECVFAPEKNARLLVDAQGVPRYLLPCHNRIDFIKPVPVVLPTPAPIVVQPAPVVQTVVQPSPPQVVYVDRPVVQEKVVYIERPVYIQPEPRYCPPPMIYRPAPVCYPAYPARYCDSSDYRIGLNFRFNLGDGGGRRYYAPPPAYYGGGQPGFRAAYGWNHH